MTYVDQQSFTQNDCKHKVLQLGTAYTEHALKVVFETFCNTRIIHKMNVMFRFLKQHCQNIDVC